MKRLVIISFLWLGASNAHSATIHVPADQPTIQAGIGAVSDGDTVLVADGTYTGPGNRDIDLLGKRILVCSENGLLFTTIDCQGDSANPHRAFVFQNFEDTNTVIEGFTITGGYGLSDAWTIFTSGGAILIKEASPTIQNCVLTQCSAYLGGAVHVTNGAPRFTDCQFLQNTDGGLGGGIYSKSSTITMVGCRFDANSSSSGGAAYFAQSTLILDSCQFIGNTASDQSSTKSICYTDREVLSDSVYPTQLYGMVLDSVVQNQYMSGRLNGGASERSAVSKNGGGLYCDICPSVTIRDCSFQLNSATDEGGAIYNLASSATFENSVFLDNGANAGGAVRAAIAGGFFSNCRFEGNHANWGGAFLSTLGGVFESTVFLKNYTLAYRGSALYFSGATALIRDCTFHGNFGGLGGTIACDQSSPDIQRSIMAFSPDGSAVHCYDTISAPTATCTNIFGNAGGDWTGCLEGQDTISNNFSADPLFCDTALNDLSLRDNSPCLASNNNCDTLIGALQQGCSCCDGTRGDVNGDGNDLDIVDLTCTVDFLFGVGCAMPCPAEADVNADGSTGDIIDLTFTVDWLFGTTPTLVACP